MKTFLLSILVLGVLQTGVAQSTHNPDEAAIKAVIEGETAAFGNYQADKVLSYWVNAPYVTHSLTLNGYEAFKTALVGLDKNRYPLGSQYQTARNSDYRIHLNGTSAWVTFVQERTTPGGPTRNNASRYLEKGSDGWKLVALVEREIIPPMTEAQLMTLRGEHQQDPTAFLRKYAVPDFVFVGSEGTPYTLDQTIGLSNRGKLMDVKTENLVVRNYGPTAVATGVGTLTLQTPDNKQIYFKDAFTYTYAYQEGRWRWVSAQHAKLDYGTK